MSLVAYADSSDEESDEQNDDDMEQQPKSTIRSEQPRSLLNGHISDDDDDDEVGNNHNDNNDGYEASTNSLNDIVVHRAKPFFLPKPKNLTATTTQDNPTEQDEVNENVTKILARLPMPKDTAKVSAIVEEDDEFLHKKATALPNDEKPKPPAASSNRATVKFMIPSMKDFADVDEDLAKTLQQRGVQIQKNAAKRSGLLEVLPRAKSEQNFAKSGTQKQTNESVSTPALPVAGPSPLPSPSIRKMSNPLIPDTVRNRRPAKNTEGVDFSKPSTNKKPLQAKPSTSTKISLVNVDSDSEASDDDADDFFALNDDDEKLPEINSNELHVMIAKRAAKIETAANKYLESVTASGSNKSGNDQQPDDMDTDHQNERAAALKRNADLNEEALQALVGSKSKRRRQQQEHIDIVDLDGSQVMPDRSEWMRTALASSTAYQPTGVLVDEEPASGTRRKHQITYLAHKAKANEAELQALWAANRQNRRATQSKYGF